MAVLLHCRRDHARPDLDRRGRCRAAVDSPARAVRDRDGADRHHAGGAGARDAGGRGRRARDGLGEAAALPPVTREDQPELLAEIAAAAAGAARAPSIADGDAGGAASTRALLPGARGARGRRGGDPRRARRALAGVPLYARCSGAAAPRRPSSSRTSRCRSRIRSGWRRARRAHRRAGFTCFKVKVGRDWRADLASLRAVAAAVPDARFRLDANAGFAARDALALLDAALADGLAIECFEQPCAADDLRGHGGGGGAFAGAGRRRRIVPRRRRSRRASSTRAPPTPST